MITDLERIGDQAGDIAEIVKTTDLSAPVKATRLGEMAKAVASMVRESIESFANGDLKKTKEVIEYDDVIDNLFSEVKKELAAGILNGEATQEQILDVLMIAKYLERIGDHATNIAEWAEYAITGVHRNSEMEEHLKAEKIKLKRMENLIYRFSIRVFRSGSCSRTDVISSRSMVVICIPSCSSIWFKTLPQGETAMEWPKAW